MTFSMTGARRHLCLATALMTTMAAASLGQAQEQSRDPPATQHDMSSMDMGDHTMTPAMFTEFREKIPLYREYSDEQIMQSMRNMGADHEANVTASGVVGDVGILALGHGYNEPGDTEFTETFKASGAKRPTAVGLGMAMMSSAHIQKAVDQLEGAGAKTIVVLPITEMDTGSLKQQWEYIFGRHDEAPWISVPRARLKAKVVIAPTPSKDPVMAEMLLDYAKAVSKKPRNEVVAIIAHGPTKPENNKLELAALDQHVAWMRKNSDFADIQPFSLQDDAPSSVRAANVQRIRNWIETETKAGRTVLVVGNLLFTGSVHKKIIRDLQGLDYTFNPKPLAQHPAFTKWIETTVKSYGGKS